MAITIGAYEVANGKSSFPNGYDDLKTVFDYIVAGGTLTGDITLNIAYDLNDDLKAVLNTVNLGGHNLIIDCLSPNNGVAREGFKIIADTNQEIFEFTNVTNGNIIIRNINIYYQSGLSIGPAKKAIAFGSGNTANVQIHNSIVQGAGRGATAIYIVSGNKFEIWRNEFSNLKDISTPTDGYGLEINGASLNLVAENNVFHNCGNAIRCPNNEIINYNNNLHFANNTDLFVVSGPSNQVIGKNNGTDKSGSFGFNTESGTEPDLFAKSEVYTLDSTDFYYLKVKRNSRISNTGLPKSSLLIPFNITGIRGNALPLLTTSIGADEVLDPIDFTIRDVPPQGGPGNTAGNIFAESLTKNLPDRGDNFTEVRLYILDHGKENPEEAGRDPEWVDFTEFAGIYRVESIPDVINIGTEGVKPFRFKASSLSLKLNNSDYAFDNLKTIDFKTVNGNDALFLKTPNGTNLDIQFRPAKLVGKFPKAEMTVAYDLAHFRINSFTTDLTGSANLKLDSLEKEFIEKDASSVKDGKNWYFDRSVKFLVEELIKSVRREYDSGTENTIGNDTIDLSAIETGSSERVFSEMGRPIVTVNPQPGNLTKGEKRLIVTAAAPRNIFRSKLQTHISAGSNYIRIRIDNFTVIKKDDVLTLGRETDTGSGYNEEKITVLEDVTFQGVAGEILNIKVSSLKKDHDADEIVERWIIYLGCSRDIEDANENYIVAFDPDRDEYAEMSGTYFPLDGNKVLQYTPRFLHLRQTLSEYGHPVGNLNLLVATSVHSFPGKPCEPGKFYVLSINKNQIWNVPHLLEISQVTDVEQSSGGVYTGELSYRSLKPMLTTADLGVTDPDVDLSTALFGARGIGKFVEEMLHDNGVRSFGFGYMAGLAENVSSSSNQIKVAVPANNTNWWAVHPVDNYSGTVYLIGGEEEEIGHREGIGETFNFDLEFFSARITQATKPENGIIEYAVNINTENKFDKNNTVVIVIPDSGKMYVRNLGENLLVNETQNVGTGEYLPSVGPNVAKALDTDSTLHKAYHDEIKFEKKSEIDRAAVSTIRIKEKVDNTAIEKGYYSNIIQPKKLEVNAGDIIQTNGSISSNNLRIIPGQYTAHPFAPELWRLILSETPVIADASGDLMIKAKSDFQANADYIIGDKPPVVYEGTLGSGDVDINGNSESIMHPVMQLKSLDEDGNLKNRNIHVWNYPIIGLWTKYNELNKSLLSFDGTVIADNGNAELLGYWYLDYDVDPGSDGQYTDNDWPRLQIGYSDKYGVTNVKNINDVPDEHFPLSVVLHNIVYHNGGPGTETLDFYGSLDPYMLDRIQHIVGGSFQVFTKFVNDDSNLLYEEIFGINTRGGFNAGSLKYNYLRWDPAGTKFTKTFPLNMRGATYPKNASIVLKFKPLRNPQAKGTLFVASHCYPVKIRHLHLPHNESAFEGTIKKEIVSEKIPADVEIPLDATFAYTGKIIDTNFESGSEEMLNKGPEDENVNFWVLDRYSQKKSLSLIVGAGLNHSESAILRGLNVHFFGQSQNNDVEIPFGYKGTVDEGTILKIKYTEFPNAFPIVNSVLSFTEETPADDTMIINLTGTPTPDFDNLEVGSLIKLDGCKNRNATDLDYATEIGDGIYEFVKKSSNQVYVKKVRVNDNISMSPGLLQGFYLAGSPGSIKRYTGLETIYTDSDVAASIGQNLIIYPPGDRYELTAGDVYSYDGGSGRITFEELDGSDLVFSWNGKGADPSSIVATYKLLNKESGSGPNVLSLDTVTSTGTFPDIPDFIQQGIDHRDHLPGQPAGSEAHPIQFSKTFLSYHKIVFNCPPTFNSRTNYPRALCGRSWEKFWKYNERRSIEEFLKKPHEYAMASISPLNSFAQWMLTGNLRLRGGIKSNYARDYEIPDLGADYLWQDYVRYLRDDINSNSGFLKASVKTKENDTYDSIYIFNLINGVPFNSKTFVVKEVIYISPDVDEITLDPNGISVSDKIQINDILFISNKELQNDTFFKVSSVTDTTLGDVVKTLKVTGKTSDRPPDKFPGEPTHNLGTEKNKRTIAHRNYSIFIYGYDDLISSKIPRYDLIYCYGFSDNKLGTLFHLGEDNPYGEGDGVFDSGIKPTAFTDTFINSLTKWYLSRHDVDAAGGRVKILADTYTINHDKPFLGDDDNLYAIVNRHPNRDAVIRFPYVKFSLGTQKNFRGSLESDSFYFTRANFSGEGSELRIKYNISKYNKDGITSIYDIPEIGYIADEDQYLKSDFEIHGIFRGDDGTNNVNFGFIKWVNKGNVNLYRNTVGGQLFVPEHRYFSKNFLAYKADATTPYVFNQFENIDPLIPSPLTYGYAQDADSFTIVPSGPYIYKYIEEKPIDAYRNGVTPLNPVSVYNGRNWLVAIPNTIDPTNIKFLYANTIDYLDNDFQSIRLDAAGMHAYLSLIKNWTDVRHNFTIHFIEKLSNRGVVLRRHDLLSETEANRDKREDLCVFHSIPSGSNYAYFENQSAAMFPYGITTIKEFSFRDPTLDGYYFTNNFDNTLGNWNGETITTGSSIVAQGNNFPTVEGDFNQYDRMILVNNSYNEIFGFSMGPKAHMAIQSFRGGRNIVWKFSKALSFHIAVADFEDLSVWDALGQFAELTDCVVGFDRLGNLRFQPRPDINSDSAFFFTFDNFDNQNIISMEKKPPFQHIYNEIEIIPHQPELPSININLTTQSDLNIVNVNHDLFIKNKSLEFNEKSPNKARPNIHAFQKDYKRKRILLVCTNGQFSSEDAEARGLYSRFKYKLIEDLIEIRLTVDAEAADTELNVNKIPFDTIKNKISFDVGDILYIGSYEFSITSIDPINKKIGIDPAVDTGVRFESGLPVTIANFEQSNNSFHADGDGTFPGKDDEGSGTGFTYSPKTFFSEVGEWTFKEDEKRIRKAKLVQDIGPGSELIPVDDISVFPEMGTVSIAKKLIDYDGKTERALKVNGPIPSDIAAGFDVYPMPISPINGGRTNTAYYPGNFRLGGYDELGPSCLNEYHLLDPNEDGIPYYDGDPNAGGRPISALEFYASDSEVIQYTDPNVGVMNNTDYRVRDRTYVDMKIDFNGFRFSDGDKIDLDVPGIHLQQQMHLKQTFSNFESIKRNGLRQYPATGNRFFNATTARLFAIRNLNRINKIGNEITIEGLISDINDLDWLTRIRIVDNKLFGSFSLSQVVGYISSMKFSQRNGTVTLNILTQET